MAEEKPFDVLIIGGGVSGLSAGMYAGRLGLKTALITEVRGGTLVSTTDIENWPGIKKTDGVSLMKHIEDHAASYDIKMFDAKVSKVDKSKEFFTAETEGGKKYTSKTLIIATGTEIKKMGIKGEVEYSGKGVHYCALCDGSFYKDKIVAVIGGSDSAAKEALLLTQWASKVYILYRGKKIRAEPVNMKRVEEMINQEKIAVINNTNITEIVAEGGKVKKVLLDKEFDGKKELELNGIFVEIGRIARSGLAKQLKVKLNKNDEIVIDHNGHTNVSGVYAAGDVTDSDFKQAIVGSSEGVIAAYNAYNHIHGGKKKKGNYS